MTLIASETTDINAPPEAVWGIVADIDKAKEVISGIKAVEVLEQPTGPSIVGLKWKETREFMGRAADETIWVTDARDNAFYDTRAESHGSVYQSRIELQPEGSGTRLSMDFHCEPVTFGAKVMWLLTGWMAKGSLKKILAQDLKEIKAAAER